MTSNRRRGLLPNLLIVLIVAMPLCAMALVRLSNEQLGFLGSASVQPMQNEFIYETAGSPDSLDPHISYKSFGTNVLFNVYEILYTFPWGSNSTEPRVPLLASAPPWISPDGKQYNIPLRQDVTFHDGTPFNASCVKWNIERAVKMFYLDGPVWTFIGPLKGGSAVEGEARANGPTSAQFQAAFDDWVANSSAIVVLDTYTIQFNLEYASSAFIPTMSHTVGSIISPSFAIAHASNPAWANWDGYAVDYGEKDTYMKNHTCGTGPYMLDEWIVDVHIKLVAFSDYWRADEIVPSIAPPAYAGAIQTVYYKTNEDANGRMSNLRGALADSVYWPKANAEEIWDDVLRESKDPSINVSAGDLSYDLMAFTFKFTDLNISRGGVWKMVTSPFIYRDLRKCFAYAFDYDAAIHSIIGGWGFQAKGFIPQGMAFHNSSYWQERYDIDEAVAYWNAAMNEPGFMNTINAMEGHIDLYYSESSIIDQQGLLLIRDGFATVMAQPSTNLTGISPTPEIRLNTLESALYQELLENNAVPIWLIGWVPDYADPDNYAWPMAHSLGIHMSSSGYGNSTVDDWINLAKKEMDTSVRQALYGSIQKQLAYDQPSIYMFQSSEFRVWREWARGAGLAYSPMHGFYFYHVWKVAPTTTTTTTTATTPTTTTTTTTTSTTTATPTEPGDMMGLVLVASAAAGLIVVVIVIVRIRRGS